MKKFHMNLYIYILHNPIYISIFSTILWGKHTKGTSCQRSSAIKEHIRNYSDFLVRTPWVFQYYLESYRILFLKFSTEVYIQLEGVTKNVDFLYSSFLILLPFLKHRILPGLYQKKKLGTELCYLLNIQIIPGWVKKKKKLLGVSSFGNAGFQL